MTERSRQSGPGPERVPEHLIDALFDRRLDEASRERVLRAVRANPAQRREVEETTRLLRALRAPVSSPDFTARVLAETDRRRLFLPRRLRRVVTGGRLAMAASVALAAMGVALYHRAVPGGGLGPAPATPVTGLDRAVREEVSKGAALLAASESVRDLAGALFRGEPIDGDGVDMTERRAAPRASDGVRFAVADYGRSQVTLAGATPVSMERMVGGATPETWGVPSPAALRAEPRRQYDRQYEEHAASAPHASVVRLGWPAVGPNLFGGQRHPGAGSPVWKSGTDNSASRSCPVFGRTAAERSAELP